MALITEFQLIERLCVNITPAMRRFCRDNFGNPQYPEEWLRGVECPDPDNAQPFTSEFWWKQIISALPYVEDSPW